jgi:hypothetical protein
MHVITLQVQAHQAAGQVRQGGCAAGLSTEAQMLQALHGAEGRKGSCRLVQGHPICKLKALECLQLLQDGSESVALLLVCDWLPICCAECHMRQLEAGE